MKLSPPIHRYLATWPCPLWNARLVYLASFLILMLQRSPVLRLLLDGRLALNSPRLAHVLKFSAVSATVHVGGAHALTGATNPEITPVAPSANPADAEVGTPFVWVFSATAPGMKARSYLVEGLPPGIEYNDVVAPNSFAALQGTPTSPGTFNVEITAFHFANLQGESSAVFDLTLNVTGEASAAPSLTQPLTDQLITAGSPLILAVETTGEALTYRWEKDGVAVEGADGPLFQVEAAALSDAGRYVVFVSNAGGEVSSVAEVTVADSAIPIPDGQGLYSISARDAQLRSLQADGSILSAVPLVMEGQTVTGGAGLATDPTTGTLYAILKLASPPEGSVGDRVLATVDPGSGHATLVGFPSAEVLRKFSGLAFDPAGQLFGVTGDDPGADSRETLFSIDKTNGHASKFLPLGNGDQGEAIAFDPETGALLHASGGAPPQEQVLESVDLANQTLTPVPVQGGWKEGKALAALGGGQFLLADETAFYLLTREGGLAPIGTIDHVTKGLAFAPLPSGQPFRITRIEMNSAGHLVLGFPALPGEQYRIESSDDLVQWQSRGDFTVGDQENEFEFTDTEITTQILQRFYRATKL